MSDISDFNHLISKIHKEIEKKADDAARENGSKIREHGAYLHGAGRVAGLLEALRIIIDETKKAIKED